jgi:hypothetical protein
VEQKVAVERNLAGLQNVVHDRAEPLRVVHGLVEDVVLVLLAQVVGEMAVVVRAGDEAHARVLDVGVVDRQPDGHRLRRRERPVGGVLVPGNGFAVAGHLAEEVRAPSDHVRAEEVADQGDDARVGEQVVDAPVFPVGGGDGIAVAALGEDAGEQRVEVGPDLRDLGLVEDADATEVAVAVERLDLRGRERLRIPHRAGVEPQIALDRPELVLAGNESRCRLCWNRRHVAPLSVVYCSPAPRNFLRRRRSGARLPAPGAPSGPLTRAQPVLVRPRPRWGQVCDVMGLIFPPSFNSCQARYGSMSR